MGSLTSRPKSPAQSQTVFVPQPAPTPTLTQAPPPQTDNTPSAEETSSEARRQNLLGRERSRFGTVQTGFRGLLGLTDNSAQRKTLLGE